MIDFQPKLFMDHEVSIQTKAYHSIESLEVVWHVGVFHISFNGRQSLSKLPL